MALTISAQLDKIVSSYVEHKGEGLKIAYDSSGPRRAMKNRWGVCC